MVTTRSANRPATRSTTKRQSLTLKTADSPKPQDSASKRQKLPLRKKTGAASPSSDPAEPDTPQVKRARGKRKNDAEDDEAADEDLDNVEVEVAADSIVVNPPEVEVANDMDAELQSQLAEQHPETPVVEKGEEEAKGLAAHEEKKTAPVKAAPAAAEESDSDSDDDAPEAISNVQAASSAKQAAQAAQKAAKEGTERLKRKRKERDTLYKEQAHSKKAKEPTEQPVPERPTSGQEEKTGSEVADEDADDTMKDALPSTRPGKFQPPALLPSEFLDSDSEDDDQLDLAGPQRKKRKTLPGNQQKDKAPRDKKIGGTIYRVVKQVDTRLAPKKQKASEGVRARLMARNREGVPQKKGFLVGRSKGTPDWGSSRKG